jgi:hypothetical protein
MILCKVSFNNDEYNNSTSYKTLGPLRRVEYQDSELFIDYLTSRLGLIIDSYSPHSVNEIIFTYVTKKGKITTSDRILLKDLSNKELSFHEFNKIKLPISMSPEAYGTILAKTIMEGFTRFITTMNKRVFQIDISLNQMMNKVTILGASDFSWVDIKLDDNTFKREIGKSTLYFLDGEIVLQKLQLNFKSFSRIRQGTNLISNFVTMDIETIIQNNKIIPYLICAFNGQSYIESFSLNQQELFSNFIKGLLTFFSHKTKTLTVFAHNLSGFDGIFLLNHLIQYGTVEPLLYNGKLITIKLILNIDGYYGKTIIFKDSLFLLPISLRKLALIFKTTQVKGVFPYKLYNIFYNGIFPKFEYFTDLTLSNYISLYLEFKNKNWNFKDQAIKYCKLDCLILFEILTQFNELIFNEFKVNIDKVLTLPALSMRIFKTLFMKVNSIYQIHGKVEQAIRESYSGGAVDVYIPHNKVGTYTLSTTFRPLFVYDVNSLYPLVMSSKPMPIGKPTAFEGNILKFDSNAYGFFYCKMTSPAFIDHPILQRRIKISGGTRTIAGLGTWFGWIYSEEMYNAVKF